MPRLLAPLVTAALLGGSLTAYALPPPPGAPPTPPTAGPRAAQNPGLPQGPVPQASPRAPLSAPDPDPWLGPDKALHCTLSAVIAGAGYGVTALFTNDIRLRTAFGGGVALAAGAGKELLDLAGYGDPSWKDFTWDVIGTVIGLGIAISIDVAVRSIHPGQAHAP